MPVRYRLKRRAERQRETRLRIVEAAVGLHTTVGPAHTTDAAIAEGAGVTRMTFYRHFPDDASLFRACSHYGLVKWPPPDPRAWRLVADPEDRLRLALRDLYDYYKIAGLGLVVIMRDAPLLRPEFFVSPNRMEVLRSVTGVLIEPWAARGRRRQLLATAINHATAVPTWWSLVHQQGLADEEAIDLVVAMVIAASRRGAP